MRGPIGILDGLSNDQQDQLLTWLELYPAKDVLDMVAAPPPDGFGIRTHITSLRRFQQQAQLNDKEDDVRLARRAQFTAEELGLNEERGFVGGRASVSSSGWSSAIRR